MIDIVSAYGGLKAAYDIAKGLNAADTKAQINDVKIALQEHILNAREALEAARETQSTSAGRISQLEQEIVRLKDWTGEKQRYELINVRHGAMAYAPKHGMENGEPAHWLCANCFDQSRKSFLQIKGVKGPDATYACDTCKSSFTVSFRFNPESLRERAGGVPIQTGISDDALRAI